MSTGSKVTKPIDAFKTFPEFSKLMLADREAYDKLIEEFPAVDDITFSTLASWWNSMESCRISVHNGNLIVSYWLPAMEEYSGLAVIGTNQVDETVCLVLDELKRQGKVPKLTHVPDFTIAALKHPELFTLHTMPEFQEYIMPITAMYPLSGAPQYKQHRIERFLGHTKGRSVTVRNLDMADPANQDILMQSVHSWPRTGKGNDFSTYSDEVMQFVVSNNEALDIKNLCLFVDDALECCSLYHVPRDTRYVNIQQFRVNSSIPYTFEYAGYVFCEWFGGRGVTHLNLSHDAGLQRLRTLKMSMGPTMYFQKYTIEPSA